MSDIVKVCMGAHLSVCACVYQPYVSVSAKTSAHACMFCGVEAHSKVVDMVSII